MELGLEKSGQLRLATCFSFCKSLAFMLKGKEEALHDTCSACKDTQVICGRSCFEDDARVCL